VLREGGVGARVRDAGRRWVPLVVVVGDREVETKTVTLRRRWEPGRQEVVSLEELLEEVKKLNTSKP
jgi:threonyl-tRNA synthetase